MIVFCLLCRKVNYDLCSICINEIGNQTDYIRMDRPLSFRAPRCSYQNTKEFVTSFELNSILFLLLVTSHIFIPFFFYGSEASSKDTTTYF
jgi:hypothetical protein